MVNDALYIHLDSLVSELLGDICEPAPLLDKVLGEAIPGSSSIPLCAPLCRDKNDHTIKIYILHVY